MAKSNPKNGQNDQQMAEIDPKKDQKWPIKGQKWPINGVKWSVNGQNAPLCTV